MKKTVSIALVIAMLMLILLSMAGCDRNGDDKDFTEYYNYGLHYKLPKEYTKLTVSYSEHTYYNGEAYFYFNFMSDEKLDEALLPTDITVEAYAYNFAALNEITSPVMYDKATDTARIEYIYDYSDDELALSPEFYYHYILRGSQLIYIVTMSCPASKQEQYKPIFNQFITDIKPD